jgi:hypothetical protein
MTSVVDLYSASVFDLDTVAYFLAFQEIKLGTKIHWNNHL